MKRLKYGNAFCGYGYRVMWIALGGWIVWMSLSLVLETACGSWAMLEEWLGFDTAFFLMSMTGPVLALVLSWLWLHFHLNREERQLVAQAQPLQWHPIKEEVCERIRSEGDETRITAIFLFVLYGILLLGSLGEHFRYMLPFLILALVVILLILLGQHRRYRFWQGIDETAETSVVTVDHSYVTHFYGRGGKTTDHYLVFYLPDGRYALHDETSGGTAARIRLVRYRGRVRWMTMWA